MKSPTGRLIAGLVFTLLVIGAYAAFTLHSVVEMREVQTSIVERNRKGSLQLIRIQNDLNALGLAMRDAHHAWITVDPDDPDKPTTLYDVVIEGINRSK